MKIPFYIFIISLLFFVSVTAQETNPVTTNGEETQDDRTRKKVLESINLTINAVDSLDLGALDSILTKLDTLINRIPPPSKIYGHDIFVKDSLSFFHSGSISDSYILDVGDQIVISIFGVAQFDGKYIIKPGGFIQPSEMPKIFLKEMSWLQAQQLLKTRFANYYRFRSEQFAASLVEPRNITVNIFGEVTHPGSYSLSATNTAFNAIIAAGGPLESGSVRNIKIYNGKDESTLDIYQLMNNPSIQFDYFLKDNAIIQIPSLRRIVTIKGAVQRPLQYELKEREGLLELIEYAGGLRPDAVKEVVQIKSYKDDQQTLIDVNLQELILSQRYYPLQSGDEITIKSIENELINAVSIEGAIELPGEYSLTSTPRISTLVKKAVLKREARMDIAFLVRVNPDSTLRLIEINLGDVVSNPGSSNDLFLEPLDKLVINDQITFVDRSTISVKGAVRKEIEYPFDPTADITLSQAILLAGGLNPEATESGFILRTNPNNQKEKEYITINVKEAVRDENGTANVNLQPWDEVIVFAASKYSDVTTVSIKGAVRFPGRFHYDKSLNIKDLILLGGGLKDEASLKLQIYSINTDQERPTSTEATLIEVNENYNIIAGPSDFKLMPFDEVVVRRVPAFEFQSFVEVKGQVLYPGEYALTSKNETLSSLIKRSGGLTSDAFAEGAIIQRVIDPDVSDVDITRYQVVTQLDEVLKNEQSKYNYILKKGDIIIIPKNENVVYIDIINTKAMTLISEDAQTSTLIGVAYESGKSAKWYIEEFAGGFGSNADKGSVTVKYANGAIKKTKGGLFKKYPKPEKGATISIGSKIDNSNVDIDQNGNKIYPRLRKGVIINVGADGSLKTEGLEEKENE